MASKVRQFFDGLTNALTGVGTTADPRYRNAITVCPLGRQRIEGRDWQTTRSALSR